MAKFLIGKNLYASKPLDNKVSLFSKSNPNELNKKCVLNTYEQIIKEIHLQQPQKLIIGHLINHETLKWIVKVIQNKGKSLSTMGYSTNNFNYFLLEEALYLMESAAIQVFYGEIPLSIEQMYNIISDVYPNAIDRYLIYKSLLSTGFIVRLHNCTKLTQITQNYNNPLSKSCFVDCSDIPTFVSNTTSQINPKQLNKLNMFKEKSNRILQINCQVLYDIYSEGKTFSKTKIISPDFLLCHSTTDFNDQLIYGNIQCNSFISLLMGIVDEGDVSFIQVSKSKIPDLIMVYTNVLCSYFGNSTHSSNININILLQIQ